MKSAAVALALSALASTAASSSSSLSLRSATLSANVHYHRHHHHHSHEELDDDHRDDDRESARVEDHKAKMKLSKPGHKKKDKEEKKDDGLASLFGDTLCPCIGFDGIEGETTVTFDKLAMGNEDEDDEDEEEEEEDEEELEEQKEKKEMKQEKKATADKKKKGEVKPDDDDDDDDDDDAPKGKPGAIGKKNDATDDDVGAPTRKAEAIIDSKADDDDDDDDNDDDDIGEKKAQKKKEHKSNNKNKSKDNNEDNNEDNNNSNDKATEPTVLPTPAPAPSPAAAEPGQPDEDLQVSLIQKPHEKKGDQEPPKGKKHKKSTKKKAKKASKALTKVVPYPADLGARCEAWDNGRHPLCKEGETPGFSNGWCSQQWCFVDPCNCQLPVLPKMSGYIPDARYRGKPLFYSYSTCGAEDMYSKIQPEVGKLGCQCVGFDNVPGETEVVLKGKHLSYPAELGGSCRAWDAKIHPECKSKHPPSWCRARWCYVDPCSCNLEATPKVTTYLPKATFTGKSLYYSYETCGSKDTFTEEHNLKACVNQEEEKDCLSLERPDGEPKCAWTGQTCVGAELVNHPLCESLVGKERGAAVSTSLPISVLGAVSALAVFASTSS